jgi:hypothetical protein
MSSGHTLPSFMSVNPTSGAISVTSSGVAGTYQIIIFGTLQTNDKVS